MDPFVVMFIPFRNLFHNKANQARNQFKKVLNQGDRKELKENVKMKKMRCLTNGLAR
jgi:hypothetical protein